MSTSKNNIPPILGLLTFEIHQHDNKYNKNEINLQTMHAVYD